MLLDIRSTIQTQGFNPGNTGIIGMSSIGRAVVATLVAVLVATGFSSAMAADELSGEYRMEGVNPDGSDYVGSVRIQRQGDGYLIEWLVGERTFRGQGIAVNDSLAVSAPEWVVLYVRADDGSLVGAWLPTGTFEAGLERLVPVSRR